MKNATDSDFGKTGQEIVFRTFPLFRRADAKAPLIFILFLLLPFFWAGCTGSSGDHRSASADTLFLPLPERDPQALPGSLFIRQLDTLPFEEREEYIRTEILSGNVPSFLRAFRKITYSVQSGEPHTIEFYTLPDYLAVGSDSDFVRIPMGPLTAQRIADSLHCSLPTAMLVDRIAFSAEGAIEPFPFRPLGSRNEQPIVFEDSNRAIEALMRAGGYRSGQLIRGLKKDVILSAQISDSTRRNHVTIYGWHYPDGRRIQPPTNVHTNYYVDYSHGIRLILRTVIVDGQPRDLQELLKDPVLFRLVSDEAVPMLQPTYAGDTLHPRK